MKGLGAILVAVGIIILIGMIIVTIVCWYGNRVGCKDYLKLAGDAPNVQKANEFLEKALVYMEKRGLTSGNSAFIFRTPSSDVGIWYNQIKGAQQTVANIIGRGDAASQLEKDNVLMKIREVVLDQDEKGTTVTMPPNITIFPFQWLFLLTIVVGVLMIIVGGAILYFCEEWS